LAARGLRLFVPVAFGGGRTLAPSCPLIQILLP
jgi:hypothetical protein